MDVKNWKFFCKKNILDTISLWSAIGLLWYSFISIIKEHFPGYIEVKILDVKELISTSYVDEDMYKIVSLDWWVIGLCIFLLWLGYTLPQKYRKLVAIPCRLAGIGVPILYAAINLQNLIDGFTHLASTYVPFLNHYYNTKFSIPTTGEEETVLTAFTFLSMILWVQIWRLAFDSKKPVLLTIFPAIALTAELVVGYSPLGNGLFYMFLGGMLLLSMGNNSIVKSAFIPVCVAISIWLTGVWFQSDIDALATLEKKQEILRLQMNLDLKKFNPFDLLKLDLHFDWESLGNNAPEYTGEIVLEIESDRLIGNIVYLKGFYGTNYENNNWTYDDSYFESACRNAGRNPKEVAEKIAQMPYERMFEAYNGYSEYYQTNPFPHQTNYTITYKEITSDVAYFPYLTNYENVDIDYAVKGDGLFEKSIWDKQIVTSGLTFRSDISNWYIINLRIDMGTRGLIESGAISSLTKIDLRDKSDELAFLNGLTAGYLQVPEDMEFLSNAVFGVEKKLDVSSLNYYGLDLTQIGNENYMRIAYAKAVQDYLAEQMSYSLKLDNLPMGADPIEYALTKSHEGYCMHFASAGTLLLRELGVPARYVSGYAVQPYAFEFQAATDSYVAQVGDYMAHAWVEVYLDDIGWVPVEMTPGGSLSSVPTTEQINQWESDSNANRQEIVDREQGITSEETEETEDNSTVTESEDTQTESQETQIPTESEPNNTDSSDSNDKKPIDPEYKKRFEQVAKILGAMLLFVAFACTCYWGIRGLYCRFANVLEKEMKQNQTKLAVRRMNRRLYFALRISTGHFWLQKSWSDVAYEEALNKYFTEVTKEEWKKYMIIVKKNQYSQEPISSEEMQYCYSCYKKVKLFHKSF